jgi:5-methylcytosine-specific restriction endonuclease McrA
MPTVGRKDVSARQRILDYFLSKGVGAVVTKEELMEVARISDWARRVRELRDEYGWQISSFNDRANLRPGQYVLESLEQRPASPRHIPADQRARILARDDYTCQMCGAKVGDLDPYNPGRTVRLEVDHIVPISLGGTNDDDNLQTVCNVCNLGSKNLLLKDRESAGERAQLNVLGIVRKAPVAVQLEVYEFLKRKFEGDR